MALFMAPMEAGFSLSANYKIGLHWEYRSDGMNPALTA